jgi:ribonuclease HI
MYDDKDLSVNDEVDLIDKIDPSRAATWHKFATARIDSIVQKRLGQVEENDFEQGKEHDSPALVLKKYRTYYGPQVTLDTPVKIVHFTLLNKADENYDVRFTTNLKKVKLYADGGSRGNPGPSASGYAILNMNDKIVVKKGVYLGVTTNNQAEYQALKLGLEEAKRTHAQIVYVYMDSLLVVNQMLGIFKVRNRDLWPIHDAIQKLVKEFQEVSFTHVPRVLNKIADAAVNETLDLASQSASETSRKT